MEKTKKTTSNWRNHNSFFGSKDDYDRFVKAMRIAAEEGNLSVCLEHEKPESLTTNDIKQFSRQFKHDTGLSIEFRLMTCNRCDRLHCLIIVDETEENEMESDKNDWN